MNPLDASLEDDDDNVMRVQRAEEDDDMPVFDAGKARAVEALFDGFDDETEEDEADEYDRY